MTDALTLHARGSAVVEETTDPDEGPTVTETREIDVHATFDVDAEWLREEGDVYKHGAVISRSDVAALATEALTGDDRSVRPLDGQDWELTLTGRVSTYLDVAVAAAQERRSPRATNDHVATTAAEILDSLADLAVDTRPVLGIYDLVEQYDVEDFSTAGVAEQLYGVDEAVHDEAQEAAADD